MFPSSASPRNSRKERVFPQAGKLRQRGSGVAFVLLILSVLVVMTLAVGDSASQHLHFADRERYNKQASYAAYAGLQAALDLTTKDKTWGNSNASPLTGNVDANSSYAVTVYNNVQSSTALQAADGVWVPPGCAYVLALGQANGAQGYARAALTNLLWFGGTEPRQVVLAEEGLKLTNSQVDGWSSTTMPATGAATRIPYASVGLPAAPASGGGASSGSGGASSGPAAPPGGAGGGGYTTGDLRTNASAAGSVVLDGSTIQGQVLVASGVAPQSVVSASGSTVAGGYISYPMGKVQVFRPPYAPGSETTLPCFTGNPAPLHPGAYTDLIAGQATIRLSPGDYYFSNSVSLNQCRLLIDDPKGITNIYVGRSFSATSGTVINPDTDGPDQCDPIVNGQTVAVAGMQPVTGGVPEGLRLFFCGDGSPTTIPTLNLSGSQAWMVASGARLNVNLEQGSTLYGALRCKSLTAISSQLHYDTRLNGQQMLGAVILRADPRRDYNLGYAQGAAPTLPDPITVFQDPNNACLVTPTPSGSTSSPSGGGGGGFTSTQML